jgi:hypothetical protein
MKGLQWWWFSAYTLSKNIDQVRKRLFFLSDYVLGLILNSEISLLMFCSLFIRSFVSKKYNFEPKNTPIQFLTIA